MARPLLLLVSLCCFCAVPAYAAEAEIFVYESANGSYMITNHPRERSGFRLMKVYSKSGGWREPDAKRRDEEPDRSAPSNYDTLIAQAAHAAGLDPLLIKSVMHAESEFNPNAVSHKGASGLMQLMPATAKRYGVLQIFDPRENVMGGARYLSDLLRLFDGDLELALAGYNAGENAVLARGGVPPYEETRHYVKKVMHLYRRYKGE